MSTRVSIVTEPLVQAVRPTRLAVLVPKHETWSNLVYHCLGVLCSVWGGADSIIVPFDASTGAIDVALRSLITRFDPDVWCRYVHTYEALEVDDPATFNAELTRLFKLDDESEASYVADARVDLGSFPFVDADVTPELWADLRRLTWPVSEFDVEAGIEFLTTNRCPTTAMVVDVASLVELPSLVFALDVDPQLSIDRLLAASRFGVMNSRLRSALQTRGVNVIGVPVSSAADARRLGWGLMPNRNSPSAEVLGAFGVSADSRAWPLWLSRSGLGYFGQFETAARTRTVVVVGDTFDDFAFATALLREPWTVLWCPYTDATDIGMLGDLLAAVHTHDRRDVDEVLVVSRSLDSLALGGWQESVFSVIPSNEMEVVEWSDSRLVSKKPLRQWDARGEVHSQSSMNLDESGLVVHGVAPMFPGVNTQDPIDMLWWTDVRRDSHRVPARSSLREVVHGGSGFNRPVIRIGRDGPTYFSQVRSFVPAGATLESVLARPVFRFPDAATVFNQLVDRVGATIIESDKGAFVRHSVNLWGGRDALVSDLRDPQINRALHAWLSKASSGSEPGNYLDGRRYLTIADISAALLGGVTSPVQSSLRADEVVDRYLARGILRRGLSLKCANCRNMSWYDAEDFGQTFQCRRCRATSTIDSRTRRGSDEDATWYYSLSEVVYQALGHNSRVPLLACDELGLNAKSALWLPEHELHFEDGTTAECDIWMIVDGQIVIGEAKSNGSLGASASERKREALKYLKVAELMGVDRVVFAAPVPWDDQSRMSIEAAFRGYKLRPEFLLTYTPTIKV